MWEWVQDWSSETYYGLVASPVACNNCVNLSPGSMRVARGGGYDGTDGVGGLRAAYRSGGTPDFRQSNLGFRCARDL